MYICVVKRLGTVVGVIQRVKGRRPARTVSNDMRGTCVECEERTCVGLGANRGQEIAKADFIRVNVLTGGVALLRGQVDHLAVLFGQQDARLLETLPHSTHSVGRAILVSFGAVWGGDLAVVERVEVAAGEDVRRRKRSRRLDAREQEHVVGRRQQDDGRAGPRVGYLALRASAALRGHDGGLRPADERRSRELLSSGCAVAVASDGRNASVLHQWES